ncbi:hypothetical protein V8E51_009286 [Hyaloscypha variabilis]|jgi:hypothetical protein
MSTGCILSLLLTGYSSELNNSKRRSDLSLLQLFRSKHQIPGTGSDAARSEEGIWDNHLARDMGAWVQRIKEEYIEGNVVPGWAHTEN